MVWTIEPASLIDSFNSRGEGTFEFAQEVAKVLVVSCTSYTEPRDHFESFRQRLQDTKGNVLIVSECCGQYREAKLQELRDEFPEINWIAPSIPDFCRQFNAKELLDPLLAVGIVREKV